jgi:universal stress protein A
MVVKKILLCTDFSGNSLAVRQKAIEYAAAFEADLLILHVVSSRHFGYPGFEDALGTEMARLHQKIDELVREKMGHEAKECSRRLKHVSTFLRSGEAGAEIARFAAKQHVDLIVVGTRGWGAVKQRFLGSTATQVARMATCPVLAVRVPSQA